MTGPDPLEYRRAIGRFATGVAVVTTVVDGQPHAMTCNSLTSVSLEPLLVLFCAEKIARFHDAVLETGLWAVSVLASNQEDLSRRFAYRGRPLEGQLRDVPHTIGGKTRAPILDGAVAAIECETTSTTDGGDHTIVLGRVLDLTMSPDAADPLVYYEGRYRTIR